MKYKISSNNFFQKEFCFNDSTIHLMNNQRYNPSNDSFLFFIYDENGNIKEETKGSYKLIGFATGVIEYREYQAIEVSCSKDIPFFEKYSII